MKGSGFKSCSITDKILNKINSQIKPSVNNELVIMTGNLSFHKEQIKELSTVINTEAKEIMRGKCASFFVCVIPL